MGANDGCEHLVWQYRSIRRTCRELSGNTSNTGTNRNINGHEPDNVKAEVQLVPVRFRLVPVS
jgi:hypothetical protein